MTKYEDANIEAGLKLMCDDLSRRIIEYDMTRDDIIELLTIFDMEIMGEVIRKCKGKRKQIWQ